jgi:uncharacterized membrane protein YkvA (DUF1232 family)
VSEKIETVGKVDRRQAKDRLKSLLRYLPDLVKLIYRLLRDSRVSTMDKAILGAVIVYCLNPFDLIPDAIPFIGQIDDIYLVAVAILRLLNHTDPAVLNEHWKRREDIVQLVTELAELAVFFLPGRLRALLVGNLNQWGKERSA